MDFSYYINELDKANGELSELYSKVYALLNEISNIKEHIDMIAEQLDGERL